MEDYPDEKWDEMLAVMLTAPFHLTKRFLPAMKKKGILGFAHLFRVAMIMSNYVQFYTPFSFSPSLDFSLRVGTDCEHVITNGFYLHTRQSCVFGSKNWVDRFHQGESSVFLASFPTIWKKYSIKFDENCNLTRSAE